MWKGGGGQGATVAGLSYLAWGGCTRVGRGEGGEEGSTIQVKVGGGICPCLLYFPFHFSFASFWLAVRLFLDKNEIDRIRTTAE
jgi:hypothetical protein